MSLDWNAARDKVPAAARALFAADPNVFSVGLGRIRNRPVWRVSRARPADGALLAPWKQPEHDGLEVRWTDFDRPAEFEHADPAMVNGAMSVPPRLLACGAELQNFDLDHRNGVGRSRLMNIGTLGCFVTLLPQGHPALLSNAHVLSQGNRGQRGDAVYSGGSCFQKGDLHVGAYEPRHRYPQASFSTTSPDIDSTDWNEVDAAVALLLDHVIPEQSVQIAPGVVVRLQGVQPAQLGDQVVRRGLLVPARADGQAAQRQRPVLAARRLGRRHRPRARRRRRRPAFRGQRGAVVRQRHGQRDDRAVLPVGLISSTRRSWPS